MNEHYFIKSVRKCFINIKFHRELTWKRKKRNVLLKMFTVEVIDYHDEKKNEYRL